jgi:endonuclease YncB( thermonuclease family)
VRRVGRPASHRAIGRPSGVPAGVTDRGRQAARGGLSPWLLGAAVLFLLGPTARAAALHSYAIVHDDGTLSVEGKTVRLFGIYIPPTGRDCRTFERPVRCGPRAVLALDFRARSFVHCERRGRDPDGTVVGLCRVDKGRFREGEDLSAYLLARGWALALPDAPFEYHALERVARHRGVGIWGIPASRP